MDIKELRQKVDRKKLTQAVKNPQAWKASQGLGFGLLLRLIVGGRGGSALPGKWYDADYVSILYSMQAHLRGHLHGEKVYNPVFDKTGGLRADTRTLEDQERLLEDRWSCFFKDEFVAPEPNL